jgi:hypothetical protein
MSVNRLLAALINHVIEFSSGPGAGFLNYQGPNVQGVESFLIYV